ncbi:hypothetical protein [Kosmotoga pacifica]|nr:hypothetical protein [Kosmotoga pacifica]
MIIATVATSLAGATVFSFYRVSRKPNFSLRIMNIPLLALLTILVSFLSESKIASAFLFFFAYLHILRGLLGHLSKFDDTFRAFFLSMGYTRQDYLLNFLFKYGKWKIIDSILAYSVVTTSIIVGFSELKRFVPDQIIPISIILSVLFLIMCILNWIVESVRNKLSNPD